MSHSLETLSWRAYLKDEGYFADYCFSENRKQLFQEMFQQYKTECERIMNGEFSFKIDVSKYDRPLQRFMKRYFIEKWGKAFCGESNFDKTTVVFKVDVTPESLDYCHGCGHKTKHKFMGYSTCGHSARCQDRQRQRHILRDKMRLRVPQESLQESLDTSHLFNRCE